MTDIQAPPRRAGKAVATGTALAVAMITAWEGFKAVAWHDPIDPPGINTVCYGHIEDVQIGDKYTKVQCQEMLAEDLPRYDAMVRKCIHVQLPPHRYAAIVSFTYNVGGEALCKSSVAKKLNAGDIRGGCAALLLYNKANGKYIQGLANRREAELKFCLMED